MRAQIINWWNRGNPDNKRFFFFSFNLQLKWEFKGKISNNLCFSFVLSLRDCFLYLINLFSSFAGEFKLSVRINCWLYKFILDTAC